MGLTDLETIPETGAVFTIGRSRFADNIASHFFIRKDPVVSIACGDEHSAVICQSGRLFVFGSNNWGQLGLGHKNHISKPSCVKGAEKIFACGSDQEGQLGRGTSAIGDSVTTPVLVYDTASSGSRVVQIAAGSHHSLALTNDGNVFAWGSNLEGQLGLPDVSGLVNKPTKVNIPEPVKEIGTGYYHSTFLTDSGVVYVCGESESGKLGIDVSFSTQVTPKQMQLPIAAILVACGGHHTVILAENGNLYCTGSNSSGQLGLGTSVTELHTPKLLPRGPLLQNETISQVSCGESHTAIVTESGKLFTCGDGRHAKLGLEENENNVHELTFVPNYKDLFISKVACGGCHTILVGLKRATNNHAQDVENTHTEHLQKRNSLPPLKLPANRRQSEPRDEKIDEVIKDHDKPATEFTSTSQPKMETTIENDKENVNNNDCVTITNNVSDSMKSIGETDKSVENTRKSSHEMLSVMTPKATTNVSEIESKSNELLNTMEPVETKEKSGNEKSLSTTEKSDTKEETEVNSHEEKKTAIINDDEVDTANNNDTKTTMNHSENEEKTEKVLEKKQLDDNINHSSQAIEEKAEFKNEDNIEERTSSEKQRNMSPLSSSPPPKPPRLKSENTNCSTDKENESIKMENEIKTEEIVNNESQVATGNDETKRNETGIVKSPAKSASSNSMKTKAETEDTMLIEEADEKEKMIVEGKMCNDNAPDDSDVQSPPPRTGKMSKIFKTRKPQPIENGAKSTGTESHKSKSKTCILL